MEKLKPIKSFCCGNSSHGRRKPPEAATSSECVVSGGGIQKDQNSCEEDHNPCEERVMVNNANQPSGDDDSAGTLGLQDFFGLRTSPSTREKHAGVAIFPVKRSVL